ncbi:hypothetical protein BFW01_g4053 [Lasiodiplodia theobromae]|uniref:Integral membrane protein n=1 Tax=Lasiodiplodia theobromae TaxID=45133 RepID=UPI0015C2ECAA|nr:Integral membrane protein [Lasiodiplodia theobromae]KAF4535811.1 Integral membrane protein [Lasiodiplodia theobromae]KAF9633159.1 hypothetical protein BFW01_g4053 [Lasiodiplodia theobromae]
MAFDIAGGRGNSMYILGGFGLFLVWSTLSLRIYVRAHMLRSWGWDDWMMTWAVICFTIMAAGMFCLAANSFGSPAYTLSVDTLVKLYKSVIFAEEGYVTTSMFFRLSVCCFYLRLTPVMWHIWTIKILMVVNTTYSIAYFFVLLNQCTPISFFWTHFTGDTDGTCLRDSIIIGTTFVHTLISIIADWTLNSIPLFIIIPNVTMNRRTKISALALLGLGAVASSGIIVRLIALFTIRPSNSAVPLSPPVAFWSALEATIGMTAANLATYRPFLRSLAKSIRSGPDSDLPDQQQPRSIINLSKIRWPLSRASRSRRQHRAGYVLSGGNDDELDAQELDGIEEWERGLGVRRGKEGGIAIVDLDDDKSPPEEIVRVGSEDRLRQDSGSQGV